MTRSVYNPDATHTRVRATFYAWGDDGFSGRVENFDSDFGHIVSCSTNKQFGPAAGSWSLVIKKPETMGRRSWLSLWRDPEDVYVMIQWVIDGQVIDGMLGMIDTINESTRWGAGGGETYTLNGRDVGKALEQTQCFVNVYADTAAHQSFAIQGRLTPRDWGRTPSHYINALGDAWLGNFGSAVQPWRLPPGMPRRSLWALLLDRVGCDNPEIDGIAHRPELMHPDGARPLWSYLQEYSNSLMNELYVDLAPPDNAPADALTGLRPALTLRRRPFPVRGDHSAWDALVTHRLAPEHMAERSVSKGGAAHRFNYWLFSSAQDGIEVQALLHDVGETGGRPGSIPIWCDSSIQKHGLRLWQQDAGMYVPLNLDDDVEGDTAEGNRASWVRLLASWLHALHDWYAPAPLELSGTLKTSRIFPEVRIGQRVVENGVTYYVEGVSNSWSMGQRGATVLTVTRGEHEGEHLLDHVYAEFEQSETAQDMVFMPREALQSFDEALGGLRDGEEAPAVELDMRARVDAGRTRDEAVISEGDGFTTTNDVAPALPGEGGEVTTRNERQLGHLPPTSPAEAGRARAFRGEPNPAGQGGAFDQEALEAGDPIENDDPIGGLTESDRRAR